MLQSLHTTLETPSATPFNEELFVPSSMRLSRMLRAGSGLLCELLVAIHGLHAYDYTAGCQA